MRFCIFCISEYIFTFCVMCVCLFVCFFFTRWPACWAYACSGSLPLDLCIFSCEALISIHVVANKVLSLSLAYPFHHRPFKFSSPAGLIPWTLRPFNAFLFCSAAGFYRAAWRGIARRILSVRPSVRLSVRLSHAWFVTKR